MAVSGPRHGSDDEAVDGGGAGGLFADINITPLTDIFLVLLIIFMVTTTAIVEQGGQNGGLKVNLPRAGKTATGEAVHDLAVAVLEDGRTVVRRQGHRRGRAGAGARPGARPEPRHPGAGAGGRGGGARPGGGGDGAGPEARARPAGHRHP